MANKWCIRVFVSQTVNQMCHIPRAFCAKDTGTEWTEPTDGPQHRVRLETDRCFPVYWNQSPLWRNLGTDLCYSLGLRGREFELTEFLRGKAELEPSSRIHQLTGNSPLLFLPRTRHLLSWDPGVCSEDLCSAAPPGSSAKPWKAYSWLSVS